MCTIDPLQDADFSDLTKREIVYWSKKLQISPIQLFALTEKELDQHISAALQRDVITKLGHRLPPEERETPTQRLNKIRQKQDMKREPRLQAGTNTMSHIMQVKCPCHGLNCSYDVQVPLVPKRVPTVTSTNATLTPQNANSRSPPFQQYPVEMSTANLHKKSAAKDRMKRRNIAIGSYGATNTLSYVSLSCTENNACPVTPSCSMNRARNYVPIATPLYRSFQAIREARYQRPPSDTMNNATNKSLEANHNRYDSSLLQPRPVGKARQQRVPRRTGDLPLFCNQRRNSLSACMDALAGRCNDTVQSYAPVSSGSGCYRSNARARTHNRHRSTVPCSCVPSTPSKQFSQLTLNFPGGSATDNVHNVTPVDSYYSSSESSSANNDAMKNYNSGSQLERTNNC